MGSFTIWHWIAIAAVCLLAFVAGGAISRMMGTLLSGLRDVVRAAGERGRSLSWTTIGVLLMFAVAALAASSLFNGTWAR